MDDEELIEMQEMEKSFKAACETHKEYETAVILRRIKFQNDCPHTETKKSDYVNLITGRRSLSVHCKRCKKFIKDKKENDLV